MEQRVLALIVDYYDTDRATALSLQLSKSKNVLVAHIDNGMKAPVALSEAQKTAGVVLHRTPGNLGYAGALNHAISALDPKQEYDAYWFLNSDLRVEADCLSKLLETLFDSPGVGAVGPLVKFDLPPYRVWGARGVVSPWLGATAMVDQESSEALPRWSYIPGCSLLVKAKALREVGGLPSLYRLYYEETHLCVQLQKKGWQLKIEPSAVAYHGVNSLKSGLPARHFAYYFTRNNLKFWKLCFGIPGWVQMPRMLFVVLKEVVLPIRKAGSFAEALDRLKYTGAGLIDSVSFLNNHPCRFEKKLFHDLA